MKLLAVLATLLLTSAVLAADVAAFTIVPNGRQVYDLRSRTTTLPDGGRISDQAGQVVLAGSHIRYRDGVSIEIKDAEVTGPFGELKAERMYVDLEARTLLAENGVSLAGFSLYLTAERAMLYIESEVMLLLEAQGDETPDLEAGSLVIDLASGRILLAGPYRYLDRTRTFLGNGPGDMLILALEPNGQGLRLRRNPRDQATLEHLQPFLP
jgi:hypothetical protein